MSKKKGVVYLRTQIMEEILLKNNLTKKKFSELMNIQPSYFSAILTHRYNISERLRQRIMLLIPDKLFDELFEVRKIKDEQDEDKKE